MEVIGAVQSMSGTGNCYDNANAEAFFSSFTTECFPLNNCFGSKVQARREIFEYIEIYYNNQRLHSALGYQTPNQCEAAWTKAKETTFSPEKVPVTSSAEGAVEVKRVNGINRRAHAASVGSSLFMPDYGLDRNVTFSLQDNQKTNYKLTKIKCPLNHQPKTGNRQNNCCIQ